MVGGVAVLAGQRDDRIAGREVDQEEGHHEKAAAVGSTCAGRRAT
jgi:hypothetical protein